MQATHYKIEEVIEKAECLSYMPTIVLKLMERISDPDVTVHEIVAVIEKDQGLVARIFKVANSSFYGRLQKAENLTDAVITLGLRGLKTFVIAQAVKQVLTTADVDNHSLWEHAVKVSISSAVLAKELRYDMLEDALVSGLVHDIGKAFIGSVYPEVYSLTHQTSIKDQITCEEAEQVILDFNHAEVGALITEKWGFPQKIVDVIRHHHSTDDIEEICIESQEIIHLVKLANIVSNQYEAMSDSSPENMVEILHFAGAFDLTPDRLTHLLNEIKVRWKTEGENGLFY
ncbi:MAG TPA: HDOD domain-containing protein [Candidatus Wunengus sp. YC61]|uniref:HDOD domain-containing protein n=1 Tax=Candidatus Wunengus sp. YC61 TaxID=3367698 RepID=UPI004028EA4A